MALFNWRALRELFARISNTPDTTFSDNAARIIVLQDDYITTIDDVVLFLQGHNPTLAHRICKRDFLPEASRFEQLRSSPMFVKDKETTFYFCTRD